MTTSTFSLKVTGSETGITGTFDFLNSNSRVVFRPETNLEPGTGYSVQLTTGISDVSDPVKFLEGDASSFTTAAEPVSPHITYLDPSNGKGGQCCNNSRVRVLIRKQTIILSRSMAL